MIFHRSHIGLLGGLDQRLVVFDVISQAGDLHLNLERVVPVGPVCGGLERRRQADRGFFRSHHFSGISAEALRLLIVRCRGVE